jgi:2-polyprenyl-6-methoxyphenol hydroxylase-like FAD-dependent oxidoreductase
VPTSHAQVLISGAGPTGLVLALLLNRRGVRVRIIDKAPEPGTTSRALAVHARTLEFYRQLGIADDVVRQGLPFTFANLWGRGRRAGRIELGDIGRGLSPFPFVLIYPQDVHERFLIDQLAQAGVRIDRPTELLAFDDLGDCVRARLRRADGSEEFCEADYIAGCDGAHSTVRETLGIGFAGGTYAHLFYVADVEAAGPVMNRELHLLLDESDFLVVFPLPRAGNARLIGTARVDGADIREGMTWDDVGKGILRRLRIDVRRVNWFSTYRVHHRVAERFRAGRAFLLGDAAHIHSPVGGQGMNTGIGDAVNLAWKLADVLHGDCAAKLLDTYEPERIAFARRLVATTDRAFTLVTSTGPVARVVRVDLAPRVLPTLFKLRPARRFMFRTISQIAIHNRGSWLSEGAAGKLEGGDRLPWVPGSFSSPACDDNFCPLASLDWQVHVYGTVPAAIADVCERRALPLHVLAWNAAARRAGLKRNGLYLVRPDGHIALADPEAATATLETYLDAHGLRPAGCGQRVDAR